VAECFLKLVKTGRNGEAMVVMKNFPPFIYGDHSLAMVKALAIGAKLTEMFLGGAVFNTKHQTVLLIALSALAFMVLYSLVSFLF